eukprot:scaffold52245_cov32-Tisochrysis_lutea.AAC.2
MASTTCGFQRASSLLTRRALHRCRADPVSAQRASRRLNLSFGVVESDACRVALLALRPLLHVQAPCLLCKSSPKCRLEPPHLARLLAVGGDVERGGFVPYLGATERPAPLCTTCRRRAAAGRGRLLEPGVAAHEPRAVGVRRQPFQSVGPEVPEERGGGGRILTFTYGIFKCLVLRDVMIAEIRTTSKGAFLTP